MSMPDHPGYFTGVNVTLTLFQQSWPASIYMLPLQVLYQNPSREECTWMLWSKAIHQYNNNSWKESIARASEVMREKQCDEFTMHRYYTALVLHCSYSRVHSSACKQIMRVWSSHACFCTILSAISPAPVLNTSALWRGNVLLLSAMTIVHGLLQVWTVLFRALHGRSAKAKTWMRSRCKSWHSLDQAYRSSWSIYIAILGLHHRAWNVTLAVFEAEQAVHCSNHQWCSVTIQI